MNTISFPTYIYINRTVDILHDPMMSAQGQNLTAAFVYPVHA